MHFFKSLLAGAALVAATVAQGKLSFTSFPEDVQVGKPVTVTWAGGDASAPVTLTLRKGPSENLKDVAVLTSDATGGSYTWTPESSLTDGDNYALQITQNGGEPNYTGQFSISGGSGSDSTSSSPTTATSTISLTHSGATSSSPTVTPKPTVTPSPVSSGFSTTISRNSTVSTPHLTSTQSVIVTPSASPSDNTPAPVPSDSAASGVLASPFALLMGIVAAFVYLN